MSYQKYLKPVIVIPGIVVGVLFVLIVFRYFSSKPSVGERMINPLGEELALGFFSTDGSQSFARVSTQISSTGKDLKGYYVEVIFETDNGVVKSKVSMGGDTNESFTLINRQENNLFYPQGAINYEKVNQEESLKILGNTKKSIALVLPLKNGGLTNAGFSQAFLDDGVACNNKLIEGLQKKNPSINCRPLALQFSIQR